MVKDQPVILHSCGFIVIVAPGRARITASVPCAWLNLDNETHPLAPEPCFQDVALPTPLDSADNNQRNVQGEAGPILRGH